MTGYSKIYEIRDFEKLVERTGFKIKSSQHYDQRWGDVLALVPAEDHYPKYDRDYEVFVGTLESARSFISGIQWMRAYDQTLFGSDHNNVRSTAEQKIRNQQLHDMLLDGEEESVGDKYGYN